MTSLKRHRKILFACAAVLLALFGVSKIRHHELGAVDFHLKDFQGKLHDFELERKGQGVFVHFWASWCTPCLEELPEFNQFIWSIQKEGKKDYQFWLISVDHTAEDALKVLNRYKWPKVNVVHLWDIEKESAENWGTFNFPETYLVNPKTLQTTKWLGLRDWKNPLFLKEIEDFLR